MNIRPLLPLEQQFELQVFEQQVQQLSQQESHDLLIQLREAMLYQTMTFCEILQQAWELGKDVELNLSLPTDS